MAVSTSPHLDSRNRRSQNNTPIILQKTISLLSDEILPLDINRKDSIDVAPLDLGEIPEMLDARVTDCDVETAEFAVHSLEHGLHFFSL